MSPPSPLAHYCAPEWDVTAAELEAVFAEFMRLDCWQFSFDGGPASLAAAKNLTSELVGRFCQAAEDGDPRRWPARRRSAATPPTSRCRAASCSSARCSRRSPRTT